jgi:hypothetical protein
MNKTNRVTRVTDGSPSQMTQLMAQSRDGSSGSPLFQKANREIDSISFHPSLLFIENFVHAAPKATAMTQPVKSRIYTVSRNHIAVTLGYPRAVISFSVTSGR